MHVWHPALCFPLTRQAGVAGTMRIWWSGAHGRSHAGESRPTGGCGSSPPRWTLGGAGAQIRPCCGGLGPLPWASAPVSPRYLESARKILPAQHEAPLQGECEVTHTEASGPQARWLSTPRGSGDTRGVAVTHVDTAEASGIFLNDNRWTVSFCSVSAPNRQHRHLPSRFLT